jgi:hypothetical protein
LGTHVPSPDNAAYPRPVNAVRIGRLDDPHHPRLGRIDSVGPVMIANRFAPPVDLAELDMDEVDRRIARLPSARERRSTDVAGKGRERQQQDTEQAAAKASQSPKKP